MFKCKPSDSYKQSFRRLRGRDCQQRSHSFPVSRHPDRFFIRQLLPERLDLTKHHAWVTPHWADITHLRSGHWICEKKNNRWLKMYLEASLLLALVPFGSSQLIDVPPIDPDCHAPAPCSNLYFYNATNRDRPLEILQGDHKEIKTPRWSKGVKNVAIVRVFGEHGSYTIYKKKNFKGESLCLDEVGRLVKLEDEGFESTVIRYI